MGELGGTVEYLYWSAPNGTEDVSLKTRHNQSQRSHTQSSVLPLAGFQRFPGAPLSSGNLRPQVAKAIERVGPDSRYSIQSAWPDPVREKGTSSICLPMTTTSRAS